MKIHCKAKCKDVGTCHTCGMLQDGTKTECSIPQPLLAEANQDVSAWELYDWVLCFLLGIVAIYGFYVAFNA